MLFEELFFLFHVVLSIDLLVETILPLLWKRLVLQWRLLLRLLDHLRVINDINLVVRELKVAKVILRFWLIESLLKFHLVFKKLFLSLPDSIEADLLPLLLR